LHGRIPLSVDRTELTVITPLYMYNGPVSTVVQGDCVQGGISPTMVYREAYIPGCIPPPTYPGRLSSQHDSPLPTYPGRLSSQQDLPLLSGV